MSEPHRVAGNFRERIRNADDITVEDFSNPWNFHSLFMQDESKVTERCIANSFLASSIRCPVDNCNGEMFLKSRGAGQSFRCNVNRNHERAYRIYSFFERTHLSIPDVMMFIKSYLDGSTLLQCSKFAGVSYKSTAVHWASFIREFFKEYHYNHTRHRVLNGEIEIDESLFGRKRKYERGNPHLGLRVWNFGMVERSVILYPVDDRSEETLVPLIQRHVAVGSTIYSDGLSAYCNLNDLGYKHFTVIHKHSYKKIYINTETKEEVEVHTNRIEGAWKHAKQHFKKMSGTHLSQCEGHLAEVMWRAEMKGNVYGPFFQILRCIYTLDKPPQYRYSTPLFDTWNRRESVENDPEWTIDPLASDAESGNESSTPHDLGILAGNLTAPAMSGSSFVPNPSDSATSSVLHVSYDDLDATLVGGVPATPTIDRGTASKRTPKAPSPHASTSSGPVMTKRRKRHRTDKVCHPAGFVEKNPTHKGGEGGAKMQRVTQYSRAAYKWNFSSSDEDFQ